MKDKRKGWILVLGLLVIASSAAAQPTWDDVPGVANNNNRACVFLNPQASTGITQYCFVDVDEAVDGGTAVIADLDTSMCENIDVAFVGNRADDEDFDNTAKVYNYLAAIGTAVSATDLGALLIAGATLDGNPTSTDTSALYGFTAFNTYVRFTTNSSEVSRLSIACNPRK